MKETNEGKEEILDRIEARAHSYQYEFGVCGQTVMQALQKEFGIPGGHEVIKAVGFTGAGTASMGHTCGALIGAIMAIGLACGREDLEDSAYPEPEVIDETTGLPKSQTIIKQFYERFIHEFGSWTCRDLQIRMLGRSYDLSVAGELQKFREVGGKKLCSELVAKTARLAGETILLLPRR